MQHSASSRHIEAISKGEKLDPKLVNRLASRIAEIQLPRAVALGHREERDGLRLLDRAAHRSASAS